MQVDGNGNGDGVENGDGDGDGDVEESRDMDGIADGREDLRRCCGIEGMGWDGEDGSVRRGKVLRSQGWFKTSSMFARVSGLGSSIQSTR